MGFGVGINVDFLTVTTNNAHVPVRVGTLDFGGRTDGTIDQPAEPAGDVLFFRRLDLL